MALQLGGDHPEVASEQRQELLEAALDRAERAMEQHERRAIAVPLVVELEPADVDVARGLGRNQARVR
jgi:hypothetical protein